MKNTDQLILTHYKKVAKNFGNSPFSTMRDQYIRNSEIDFVLGQIMVLWTSGVEVNTVLDIGCGNGYLLEKISELFPHIELYGLEFTPELYELSKERKIRNCHIIQGDIREPIMDLPKVDIIISERVLINILTWKEQYQAFKNISNQLNSGGHFIMIESFQPPLVRLNHARKEFGEAPLPVSYQNRYFNNLLYGYMTKLGFIEKEGFLEKNYLSTHFYLTRVLHPAIRARKGRLKDTMFVEFFNQALPSAVGDFSPILFHLFQKE
ncbi:MAG: class I SAM-dependent methyltransferase [Bdellovibrionales bacterium]|nr:class I SAM-dependent methyltransferase [Bdellovibrionales bacterium]